MTQPQALKENTKLAHPLFPINIFHNSSRGQDVLPLHWHEHIEIILMLRGEAVFHIGNQAYQASGGDLLFVNSNELHEGYSITNSHVEYYAIVFHPSLAGVGEAEPFYKKRVAPILEGRSLLPHAAVRPNESRDKAASEVLELVKEFMDKQPGYEFNIKMRLALIISHLCREAGDVVVAPGRPEGRTLFIDPEFTTLFKYVEEHYAEKITLEKAARLVSLSVHHFCKKFKKLTGRTFVEYVNLYRVNQAEKLLRSTVVPITEISEQVGFCNINYFDKVFKQYKMYSPSQCRRDRGETRKPAPA